jgi:hypothetical protein
MLLWRDAEGGGREGLLLLVEVCPFPGCYIRHCDVHAFRVVDDLVAVELDGEDVVTRHGSRCSEHPRKVFQAAVDLDRGRIDAAAPGADRDALDWFARELDPELVTVLLLQFERERRIADAALEPGARAGARRRIGRNEPCPCGSGLKYKACCLEAEGSRPVTITRSWLH